MVDAFFKFHQIAKVSRDQKGWETLSYCFPDVKFSPSISFCLSYNKFSHIFFFLSLLMLADILSYILFLPLTPTLSHYPSLPYSTSSFSLPPPLSSSITISLSHKTILTQIGFSLSNEGTQEQLF